MPKGSVPYFLAYMLASLSRSLTHMIRDDSRDVYSELSSMRPSRLLVEVGLRILDACGLGRQELAFRGEGLETFLVFFECSETSVFEVR